MRSALLLLGVALATRAVLAETLVVDDKVTVRDSTIARPTRGMHMSQVERKFGAPTSRHAAVGQPPITRWDYPNFAVFFERDIVIHAVVTGEHASAPSDAGNPDAGDAAAGAGAAAHPPPVELAPPQ